MSGEFVLRGDHNQCPACGELFNSTSAFDKHRSGKYETGRRCLSTDEMEQIGMCKNAHGFWIGAKNPAWGA